MGKHSASTVAAGASLLMLALLTVAGAQTEEWAAWQKHMPRPVLHEEYHPTCHRPCEYIGFSFAGPRDELLANIAAGANATGHGAMWHPTHDDSAPYGCGMIPPSGAGNLGQSFIAEASFDALAPCLPTACTTDSGCAWRLFATQGEDLRARLLATGAWEIVKDNASPEAPFEPQPPGRYFFEISEATGSWIGWWAQEGDPYSQGSACVTERSAPDLDFELRIHTGGEWRDLVSNAGQHRAMHLGPPRTDTLSRLGMSCAMTIGNWNNPGFPYYPDWFIEKFPGHLALDQDGGRVMGGMFDKAVPAPGIESPVVVDGTSRFIRATAAALRDRPAILYWVMGGEALYASYCYPGRWTDYSDYALRHFRAWLKAFRYPSIAALNQAWESEFESFEAVDAPRAPAISRPWLDWLDFRFASMAERFAWHYEAFRSQDPTRMIVTCNHGTLYHADRYAAIGVRPELFAAASDGFETGQIIHDGDSDLYNIMYMESLNTLGKPYCPVRLAYAKSNPTARGGSTSYTPEAARRYVYESLGGDAWHLGLIQWSGSLPDGEWGVVGTPAESEIAKLWAEIHALKPILEDMHAVKPKLAVFLSHPTWALKGFLREWRDFHVAAVEHHMPKLYIYDEQIKAGRADEFDVILSIDNSIIDPEVERALEGYVKRGGKLVIAGQFANRNTNDAELLRWIPLLDTAERAPDTDAESLVRFLGESLAPVKIATDAEVTRALEVDTARDATDWPQDMWSAASLGQTITLPHDGVRSIAIWTPTYWHKPERGFRFEVLRDGPAGDVIAARDVPGGIADNSWQEIEIDDPPPAGSVIYLRATADERLRETHLGWWSTHTDTYPGGSAFVDDFPVEGDRQVRMVFDEPVPASRIIETFILSDGLNFGVVIINTAGEPMSASIDLRPLTAGAPEPGYDVTCPLSPETWDAEGMTGRLDLAAHGSAFLYVKHRVPRGESEALVRAAAAALDTWRKLDAATPFIQYAAQKASDQLRADRPEKAAAMALKALAQTGMRTRVNTDGGGIVLSVECFARTGERLTPDRVSCEFVPTPAFQRAPRIKPGGAAELSLSRAELPPRYDYALGRYRPFCGPLRIHVSALSGDLRSQDVVDVVVAE